TYFGSHPVDSPIPPETVRTEQPGGSPAPTTPPPQPKVEIALLDLRNASATRTVETSGSSSNVRPIKIARGLLALTVQLPVGSEAGSYEVEIRKSDQHTIRRYRRSSGRD